MKAREIKLEETQEFKPFAIELTIESEEEARLLWHVFNRIRLRESIFSHSEYNVDIYNKSILRDFEGQGDDEEIRKIIEEKVKIYK